MFYAAVLDLSALDTLGTTRRYLLYKDNGITNRVGIWSYHTCDFTSTDFFRSQILFMARSFATDAQERSLQSAVCSGLPYLLT